MRRGIAPAIVVTALAAMWCALAASPPFLDRAGLGSEAALVRLAFRPVCHQMPDRSFALGGVPLAVCARCAGLYGGFLAGAIGAIGLSLRRTAGCTPFPPRLALPAAAVPLAAEWALGGTGLMASTSPGRAATGMVFGAVLALYAVPAVAEMKEEILMKWSGHAGSA